MAAATQQSEVGMVAGLCLVNGVTDSGQVPLWRRDVVSPSEKAQVGSNVLAVSRRAAIALVLQWLCLSFQAQHSSAGCQ